MISMSLPIFGELLDIASLTGGLIDAEPIHAEPLVAEVAIDGDAEDNDGVGFSHYTRLKNGAPTWKMSRHWHRHGMMSTL